MPISPERLFTLSAAAELFLVSVLFSSVRGCFVVVNVGWMDGMHGARSSDQDKENGALSRQRSIGPAADKDGLTLCSINNDIDYSHRSFKELEI